MESREYLDVGSGVYLHLRDWGQGQPIVLIHGWPLSLEMYEYQFTQLPARGFRCIGVSLRGFGKSSQPWGEYDYDVFADDIKKVLERLDLRGVTLGGFSMGGAIVLHYMARHRGERVSRLALFAAAAPSWTKREGFPYGIEASEVDGFIRACYSDRAQLMENFGRIFFRSEDAVSPKLAQWFHGLNMAASPHATAACLMALRDADLRGDMVQVKVPTAIFHGAQDRVCPFALAEEMAKGIEDAYLIRFDHSGHGLFYEEQEKFNQQLMNFAQG